MVYRADSYKLWAEKNKEHLKTRRHAYYITHKEIENIRTIKWQKDNPQQTKVIARRTTSNRRDGGLRSYVICRDGLKCTSCGSINDLVIHHKDGMGRNVKKPYKNNRLDNLITLCRGCHTSLHHKGKAKKR